MKSRIIINISILTASLVMPLMSHAQEKVTNQDVRVVREYTPSISDATKIDMMPVIDDTTTYRPVFNYSILSRPVILPGQIEPITPARLSKEKIPFVTNSRAKVGIGNYNSLMAELEYNMPSSADYLLGLSLRQNSSWGKVKLEDDEKVDAPMHHTFAGVDMKRFFSDLTLSSHINFYRRAYNYYGFQTFDTTANYVVPGYSSPIDGHKLEFDKSQRISNFNIGLGLNNREADAANIQWIGNIDFSSFGNKTGIKQNKIDLSGKIHAPINSLYFDVDLKMSFYKVSTPDTLGAMYYFRDQQANSLISALPRVGINFGNGYAEAGLLIIGEPGRENDDVKAAPHIYAQLDVAQGIVSIFGGLTGKINMNDYASIQNENLFISPDVLVQSSFYGLNILGGIKGNFSSAASFAAQVEYSIFNDEHFYTNQFYSRSPSTNIDYVNQFGVIYDDGTLLKVGGELLITPIEKLKLKLSGNYYGWELDELEKAWHKPQMDIGLGAIFKATNELQFEASMTYIGKRDAFDVSNNKSITLDGVMDINLGARYDFTRSWSFWAQINNVAAQEYQQWMGYPSYKLQAMVGASYCF